MASEDVSWELEGLTAVSYDSIYPHCGECHEVGEGDCELCNSSLGGDRHAIHGLTEDGTLLHYNVCVDCLMYVDGTEPEE